MDLRNEVFELKVLLEGVLYEEKKKEVRWVCYEDIEEM